MVDEAPEPDSGSARRFNELDAAPKAHWIPSPLRRFRDPTVSANATRALIVAAISISVAARLFVPAWVVADATHDDGLFVRLAHEIRSGNWLGPFSNTTLAKGPGFAFYLAATAAFRLPPLFAIHVLHLCAAGVIAVLVYLMTRHRLLATLTFCLMALDPAFFTPEASELIRDNWYASICLLVFGLTIAAQLLPTVSVPRLHHAMVLGTAAGIVLSAYWLGREERLWLLPAGVIAIAGSIGLSNRIGRHSSSAEVRPTRLRYRAALVWVFAVVALIATVVGVRTVNRHFYGASLVTDSIDGKLPRAYALWASVEAGTPRRYVPVSAAQRREVYEQSAAARELEAALEGPLRSWIANGCATIHICDDYGAGWFVWALRDAVQVTGHYDSAAEAQLFYERLGDEIADACRRGRLRCGRALPAFLPQPSTIPWSAVARSTLQATNEVLRIGPQGLRPLSSGSAPNWRVFAETLPGFPASREEHNDAERTWLPRLKVMELVGRIYFAGGYILMPFAVAGYALCVLRRREHLFVAVVGLAAGVALLSRVILLGLIDATSFEGVQPSYVLPARGFLQVFLALGLYLLIDGRRGHGVEQDRALDEGYGHSDGTADSSNASV